MSREMLTAPLAQREINSRFGPQIGAFKKVPSADQVMTRSEVLQGTTIVQNSEPLVIKPEPVKQTVESDISKLHTAKEVDGQIFVCDVSLYRNLYEELLQKTGDAKIAQRDTLLAVVKDGTSLIQENISALKDEKGRHVVDDVVLRASMQQTPTEHTHLQIKHEKTGGDVLTSPEYQALGKGITDAMTAWRRGNDLAAVNQMQDLALNLPVNSEGKVDHTIIWASPKAEEWENEWVRKYNGEYGYVYVGHVTEEAKVRKIIFYSFKTDALTQTYERFYQNTGGKLYEAPFEVSPEATDDVAKRPLLDKLMRTTMVLDGAMSDRQVIAGLYQAKKEVENSDTMFGIKEETMLFIQNPELRKRIELEASTPVAEWLVGEIVKGASNEEIQSQVRDKYIKAVKDLVAAIKKESKAEIKINYKKYEVSGVSERIVPENRVYLEDLRRMTDLKGAFCGDWGSSSTASLFENPLQNLVGSYTGISGIRSGGIGGGVSSGGSCIVCKINAPVEGGCGYCTSCAEKA